MSLEKKCTECELTFPKYILSKKGVCPQCEKRLGEEFAKSIDKLTSYAMLGAAFRKGSNGQ